MVHMSLVTARLVVLVSLVAMSASVPLPGLAQSASDPFNGSWRLNQARSATAWQSHPQPKRSVPEPQAHGLITMTIAGETLQYRVEHGTGTGQPGRASYTASYNDAKWQPVQGTPERRFASVTLVKINDRQHYWVMRTQQGQFAGLTLRRMADDGRSFSSVGIDPDGYVQYVRVFEKQ